MDDFYLPAAPPAHLTDFALRALSQKRVVGGGMPRHTGIRHGTLATGVAFPPDISLSPPLKIHLSHRRRHVIKRVEASLGGHVQHLATSRKQILPAPKPPLPNPSFPLHGCVSRQLHSASKLPLHRTCTLLPPFLLLLPHACRR